MLFVVHCSAVGAVQYPVLPFLFCIVFWRIPSLLQVPPLLPNMIVPETACWFRGTDRLRSRDRWSLSTTSVCRSLQYSRYAAAARWC
ncbi:hypothetical protein QBC32DRAFT_115760 [Pseudoneurospora amorphoporcata]|uniref:Uncharacterized protein n=1 Tax=Pseudoneurospora amorphoporcata TaxID=241081 RepID=A0AAN6NWU6_9PEZI|nr:hypothetical protein QBC32DRAFT_115760 [Pseudoneurospora amorphoporcata]